LTKNDPGINDSAETFSKIQADIRALEKDTVLYEDENFDQRLDAIDFLEVHIIDHIETLIEKTARPNQLILLKQRAEKVKLELEAIDNNLFKKLRADIRSKGCSGEQFKNLVGKYIDINTESIKEEEAGYDNLDVFINGLLSPQAIPEQTTDLEPEMVFYQKTPVRIIFELVAKTYIAKDDVFFDLGSGLGQAAILVNLLAGAKARGVEFEPAFCHYACECAKELNLPNVSFINTDARQADYGDGTVFFMYTPFKGEILQDVLALLRNESFTRKIKIITYGPCTPQVAFQGWLDISVGNNDNIYKPAVFTSI
jgi:hypothetical protein